jgi:hypothetical protein
MTNYGLDISTQRRLPAGGPTGRASAIVINSIIGIAVGGGGG